MDISGDAFDEQRIAERISFLDGAAIALLDDGVLPSDRVIYRRPRLALAVRGYFLLNHAYKQWRIKPGHFTELPKVAALQSLAFATFQPFRAIDPKNAATIPEAWCNEIFSLAAASAVIETSIEANRPNFYFRLIEVLSECRSESLEQYVVDLEHDINRPLASYEIKLHDDDKFAINNLITIFELISGHYD